MSERSDDRRAALLVAATAFAVYGLTACRGLYTGDDGDFATASATLGVCHPTGYPLFTLLGRVTLGLLAPLVAEPALRLNLLTAACGAAAAGVFCRFLAAFLPHPGYALVGGLLMAFSPTLWAQSLSCEVYSLATLFLALGSWLSVMPGCDPLRARGLAVVLGLSLTHNLQAALFAPGLVVAGLARRGGSWRQVLRLLPWAAGPLLLYLYLPWAARFSDSPVLWGEPGTLARLVAHVTGAQYRGLMLSKPWSSLHLRLWDYAWNYLRPEFGGPVLLLALAGLVWLWQRRRRRVLGLTLYVFVVDLLYACNYGIQDIQPYLIPSYVMVAAWVAAGLAAAGDWLGPRLGPDPATVARRGRALVALATAVVLAVMSTRYAAVDRSANFLEGDYAENALRCAPPRTVLLASGYSLFSLWYCKWVKGQRPDVVALDRDVLVANALARNGWYVRHVQRQWPALPDPRGFTAGQLVDGSYLTAVVRQALAEDRPVLLLPDPASDQRAMAGLGVAVGPFARVPWGLLERLYPAGAEPAGPALDRVQAALWPQLSTRGVYTPWAFKDPLQVHIPARYFLAHKAAGRLAEQQRDAARARQHYERAARLWSDEESRLALQRLR